jgi:hypothetical protein
MWHGETPKVMHMKSHDGDDLGADSSTAIAFNGILMSKC